MLDLEQCLYLDFEARSEASIKDVGAHAYAENPTTELLCCGWVVGLRDEIQMWRPWEHIPVEWRIHCGTWVAQNKDTERELLRQKLGLGISNWVDLATVASAAGMPRNLHDIAEALHLPVRKLARTALLALAKPRKLTKKNSEKWWTREERPELYEELETYCRADVEVMRRALAALPPLHWVMPAKEEKLARLTDRMNMAGVEVDVAGVALAQAVVEKHGAELRAEFAVHVPGVNPRYPAGVSAALGLDNSRKETVRDALKSIPEDDPEFGAHPEDERMRGALTALKTIKTASTAKLKAFQRHTMRDGRLRGAMVFHGAGRTGRWSSMGVQLHNLVRGLGVSTPDWPAIDTAPGAMERAFAALHSGTFDLMYSDPTRAVAAMMRGFIVDTNTGLLAGDFSQIEARALVTWAGQRNMVEAFRQKKDPYKLMAANIYGKPPELVNKDERFMGKQSVLGAGYGVGKHGFASMLKEIYDIDIPEAEAERIVYAYRTANPKVKQLWYAVERLAKQTLLEQPQKMLCATDVPLIAMRMVKSWLVVRLPSGRCLWYHEPELVDEGDGKSRIYYWGRNAKLGGRWDRVETYGGKLVENITQAMARDVMADAMLRLDDAGFEVAFTVHDEIVCPGAPSELDEFESVMREAPAWWRDLPLDVEVQHFRRYQK